jgi:drug/metabolite transporter (DMT)-like permease
MGLLACIWGSSFLFIKVALEGLAPSQVVLGRLAAGAVVLAVALPVRRLRFPRGIAIWRHLTLMSVVANIVPFFLFAWGEQRITSGLAGVLNATTPLLTLAAALVMMPGERTTVMRVTGIVVGLLGVVVIVAPWDSPGGSSLAGELACLGAASCYGVGFVYARRFLVNVGEPTSIAAGQILCAAVVLGLFAPVVAAQPVHLTAAVALSVLALGGLGTGLAYLLFYGLVRDVGPTSTAMVLYFTPIVAVVLGIVVRGEPLTWHLFAGAAVVIVGVALAEGRLTRGGLRPSLAAARGVVPPPVPGRRR